MIIYEVNLEIDAKIAQNYAEWLQAHVEKMLVLPGFISALIKTPLDPRPFPLCYTVDYTLANEASWQAYLANHAEGMRKEGIERFGEQVRATHKLWRQL